ncbi:MAG: alpha-hydroxy acid oxidase [Pseudomonadota bacterium]|nr:alpha-hydroxy acid oxidase [Pseudomonadota bacterium]|tara:strand:- start:1239 stop:2372 length:1134 start_codon:yes stop_codon:yes gene_type:complete
MTDILCVEDYRKLAKKRVPKMFYEYADGGSWNEETYRANTNDLKDIKFRQRVAVDISDRSTKMKLLGQEYSMPVALAPVGLLGMQHADGEIHAAKAAESFGVPFTLSTMSVCSIEEVSDKTEKPFWFQLYVMRDRDFIYRLLDRAKEAKCSALMITVDLQLMGQRHKDIRNGLSTPPKFTFKNMLDLSLKPNWCIKMLRTKNRRFGNIVGHVEGIKDMSSLSEWTTNQFDTRLTWNDIAEIRKKWDGKVILKGIMDPQDAQLALKIGADAIIVSNHGGRQLDETSSTIAALPKILDTVGDKCEVWMDGGLRTGQDILKAIAMGAKGTLIGRAFTFGLGANGEAGVLGALRILQKELDMTMALCGRKNLIEVDQSILL